MSIHQLPGSTAIPGLLLSVLLAVLGPIGCGGGDGDDAGTSIAQDPVAAAGLRSSGDVAASESMELSADAVSSAQIDLAWSGDPNDGNIAGYRVLRNGAEIAMLDTVTAYEDAGLNASTTYAYVVEVMSAGGKAITRSTQAVATTLPIDSTPPEVSSVSTGDNAPVAVNSAISMDFSTPMDKSTLNSDTFKVATSSGVPISGSVSVSGNTVTFTPDADLPADTAHTATVTAGATDTAGNALAADVITTFATAAVADTTAPTVSSALPASGATGVARNTSVSVVFSEPMTNTTLTTASVMLKKTSTGVAVNGTVKRSGNTVTFTPSANLAASTQYSATVTTGARDAAGNPLDASFNWNFSTGANVDSTPPQISGMDPPGYATNVALNRSIKARFSESMKASTLTTKSFKLKATSSGTLVSGTVSASDIYGEFIPSSPLAANTQYTVIVTVGAQDAAGNSLPSKFTWNFTTGTTLDTTRPTVTATSPKSSAAGVAPNSTVSATFSEPMRNASLTTANVTVVKTAGGAAVAGTVNVNSYTVTFTPLVALAGNTQYTATVTTGARDSAGNPMAASYAWSFTTAAATTTAVLTWNSVSAPALGGYRVYYGTGPGAYLQPLGQGLNVGNVTTYTITGLSRGTRYYFAVTAYDTSNNESALSNEVFKDIP
jgi:hypothetical protein